MKSLRLLTNDPNQILEIIQVANRLTYLRGRLFEQSQQPKVIACQGEGEHTGVTQGYSENGTSDEYPSVDNPQDRSGGACTATKEDTGDCTLPADLSLFKKASEVVMLEDKKLLEELGRL